MGNYATYFMDKSGQQLGEAPEILPIPLREGMAITIHSHPHPFKVLDWKFHHGHPDEKPGLTIILE